MTEIVDSDLPPVRTLDALIEERPKPPDGQFLDANGDPRPRDNFRCDCCGYTISAPFHPDDPLVPLSLLTWLLNLREQRQWRRSQQGRRVALHRRLSNVLTRQVAAFNSDAGGIEAAARMDRDIDHIRGQLREIDAEPTPPIPAPRYIDPDPDPKPSRRRKHDGWTT